MLNEMRKIVIILCFAFSIVNMSCEYKDFSPKEWAVDQWLEISESGYVASSYEEQYKLSVSTNYKIFSAWSDKSWLKTTVDLNSRIVNIFIEPNDGASQRHAIVTVGIQRGNKSLTRDFSVYQVGGAWDVVEGTDFRMPIEPLAASGSFRISWPFTIIVPSSKPVSVETHRKVVVLPAPLGPRNPKSSPW